MNQLEKFSNEFKAWRKNRRHLRYPEHFWDEIRKLANEWPIEEIAATCEINLSYMKYKLLKGPKPKSLTFAKVQIATFQSQVAIEFVDCNSRPMTVRFQADHEQLACIIQSLSRQRS